MALEKIGYPLSLTEEQWIQLNDFAPVFQSPESLAAVLGFRGDSVRVFVRECKNLDSDISKAIAVARLKADGEIQVNLLSAAKSSVAGASELRKQQEAARIELLKESLVPGTIEFNSQSSDDIDKDYKYATSHFQSLQDWIMAGNDTEALSPQLKGYWERLKICHDILNMLPAIAKGRRYLARLIAARLDTKEKYAYVLMDEAQQFFNVSHPKKVFYERLIEELDKIKYIAWASSNWDLYLKCVTEQRNIKKEIPDDDTLPKELYEGRIIVTSHRPEDFGFDSIDRNELKQIIEKWELSRDEKKNLYLDAGIEEAEEDIS